MSCTEIPAFDEATALLKNLLESQRWPPDVAWAFREDVYFSKRGVCTLRWPLPERNRERVQRAFANAGASDGVRLRGLCRTEDCTVASLSLLNQENAQGYIEGLAASVDTDPPSVLLVSSPVEWFLRTLTPRYRWYQRHEQCMVQRDGT